MNMYYFGSSNISIFGSYWTSDRVPVLPHSPGSLCLRAWNPAVPRTESAACLPPHHTCWIVLLLQGRLSIQPLLLSFLPREVPKLTGSGQSYLKSTKITSTGTILHFCEALCGTLTVSCVSINRLQISQKQICRSYTPVDFPLAF